MKSKLNLTFVYKFYDPLKRCNIEIDDIFFIMKCEMQILLKLSDNKKRYNLFY